MHQCKCTSGNHAWLIVTMLNPSLIFISIRSGTDLRSTAGVNNRQVKLPICRPQRADATFHPSPFRPLRGNNVIAITVPMTVENEPIRNATSSFPVSNRARLGQSTKALSQHVLIATSPRQHINKTKEEKNKEKKHRSSCILALLYSTSKLCPENEKIKSCSFNNVNRSCEVDQCHNAQEVTSDPQNTTAMGLREGGETC